MLKRIYKGQDKQISAVMVYRSSEGDSFKLKLYLEDEPLYTVSIPPTLLKFNNQDVEVYAHQLMIPVTVSSDKAVYLDVTSVPDNVLAVEVTPFD